MSDNKLALLPINDLLEMEFYIPDYQRGYRWTRTQVNDLLNDIYEFSSKQKSPNEFYCLQPIVVKSHVNKWELIDGQQRLTTIYLVLSFFNKRFSEEYRKKLFSLEYQTRPGSKEYLDSLSVELKNKNIDFYHIHEAYAAITEWFKDKAHITNDIESVFLNKVKIIWYDIGEDIPPAEVFTRLNIGKIPLTNAELVKALFLRSDSTENAEPTLQQLKIAQEWDLIEKSLQLDKFWFFISNKKEFSNRIEYLLKLIAEESTKTDRHGEYYIFIHFNELVLRNGANLEKEWQRIKDYFMTLEEWFNDRYFYHLIGYLIDQEVTIPSIREVAESQKTKQSFKRQLKEVLFKKLFNPSDALHAYDSKSKLSAFLNEKISSWEYGNVKIKPCLLLFNIITLLRATKSNLLFQFDSYKNNSWDIEHVRSVKSAEPMTIPLRKAWLEDVAEYFLHTDNRLEQKDRNANSKSFRIKTICNSIFDINDGEVFDLEKYERVSKVILKFFSESEESSTDNSIGNLALLDVGTNRGYKNAVFPVKRRWILATDKSAKFVPICTKNLFLKYYSDNIDQMMYWGKSDCENYREAILDNLEWFFSPQAEGNL